MGSWTESCGLSNLEIHEGDEVYYSLLQTVPDDRRVWDAVLWEFSMPPVRGIYNDYGGVTLLEDYPFEPFNLKKGDQYPPENCDNHMEILSRTYFVRADVYDMLRTLPSSQSYRGYQTVGDAVDHKESELTKYVTQIHEQPFWTDESKSKLNKLWNEAQRELSNLCMDREGSHGNCPRAYQKFERTGLAFLPFFLRAAMIREASGELRKTVQPSHAYASHGTPAQFSFLRFVLKTALADEWKNDMDNVLEPEEVPTLSGTARNLVSLLDGFNKWSDDPEQKPYMQEYREEVMEAAEAVRIVLDGVP